MKRLLVVAVAVGIAAASAAAADGAVIKTNWSERLDYANRDGFLRLYVRKLEVTRSSWKAWVGVTNNSTMVVHLTSRLEKPVSNKPFTYWAAPGIWWSTYLRGASWWPGSGTALTHSVRGTAAPRYPSTLGARKSWFGTFSGPTAKLPNDRLLRIGFGILEYPQRGVFDPSGRPLRRELPLSTSHQFKLPRKL